MSEPRTERDIDAEIARLTALREKLRAKAKAWPKVIAYHLHGTKDGNWDTGLSLGLSEDAIRDVFLGCCYEVTLTLQVNEDGTAVVSHLNGVGLAMQVPVATKG